jgi:hypothetical protein
MTQSIFTPLYFANYFVDQVQNSKNVFIDLLIPNKQFSKPLKDLVEAERVFTKEINRSVIELVDTVKDSK